MLTYSTYVTALTTLINIPSIDASFQAILPDCIDYAEQRLYRDLNLLATVTRDASQALTPASRNFTYPTANGVFVVTNGLNVITPAGSTPDNGTRTRLVPTSLDVLDMIWPSSVGSAVPTYFAMVTQTAIVVGPWPDQAYTVEVVGTTRPTPISADNTVTFLSANLPDLLVAASMVFLSGYLRNFGSQADDPQMAVSWEAQYKTLFASANTEELRKRYMGSAWSSQPAGGEAAPARN